jgi:hypothetical protein
MAFVERTGEGVCTALTGPDMDMEVGWQRHSRCSHT